jgi:hypothetical protein
MPEARHGIRRMSSSPIALSDTQLDAIIRACAPLQPDVRNAFLLDLAALLQGQELLGDGTIGRLIRELQKKHFDPPQFDERSEPHRRAARAR